MNKMNEQEQHWRSMYKKLCEYKAKHGDCWIPRPYAQDPYLGEWTALQRYLYQNKVMPQRHRILMDQLGFSSVPTIHHEGNHGKYWTPQSLHPMNGHDWEDRFEQLKAYGALYGDFNVSQDYDAELADWVSLQRSCPPIAGPWRQKLDSIGFFDWIGPNTCMDGTSNRHLIYWYQMYEKLKAYHARNGDCNLPEGLNAELSSWVNLQRRFPVKAVFYRSKLDSIGFFTTPDDNDNNYSTTYCALAGSGQPQCDHNTQDDSQSIRATMERDRFATTASKQPQPPAGPKAQPVTQNTAADMPKNGDTAIVTGDKEAETEDATSKCLISACHGKDKSRPAASSLPHNGEGTSASVELFSQQGNPTDAASKGCQTEIGATVSLLLAPFDTLTATANLSLNGSNAGTATTSVEALPQASPTGEALETTAAMPSEVMVAGDRNCGPFHSTEAAAPMDTSDASSSWFNNGGDTTIASVAGPSQSNSAAAAAAEGSSLKLCHSPASPATAPIHTLATQDEVDWDAPAHETATAHDGDNTGATAAFAPGSCMHKKQNTPPPPFRGKEPPSSASRKSFCSKEKQLKRGASSIQQDADRSTTPGLLPVDTYCCVCGEALEEKGALQVCRFGSTDRNPEEKSMHVICGMTASKYNDKAEYEICRAERIPKKFSGHSIFLLTRAMKLTRRSTGGKDSTAGTETFYLVTELNESLSLMRKRLSDICSRTEYSKETSIDSNSKALQQLDKELVELYGAQLKALYTREEAQSFTQSIGSDRSNRKTFFDSGGGTSTTPALSNCDDSDQPLESSKTSGSLSTCDDQISWAPEDVSRPRYNTHSVPSHRVKTGQHVMYKVDTRQVLGLEVHSETHIVVSVLDGSQAKRAGIQVGSRLVSINGNRIKHGPIVDLWKAAKEQGPTAELILQPNCKLYIEESSSDDSTSKEVAPERKADMVARDFPSREKMSPSKKISEKKLKSEVGDSNTPARKSNPDYTMSSAKATGNNTKTLTMQTMDLERMKDVGAHVFARYMNGEYYWGTITKKFNRNGSLQFYYSVQFDDGDSMDGIESQHVYTIQRYRDTYGTEPPPAPERELEECTAIKEVGSRICCAADGASQAWGTITNIFPSGSSNSYSVKLDDGTILVDVEEKELKTLKRRLSQATSVSSSSKKARKRTTRPTKKRKTGQSDLLSSLVGRGFCQAWRDVKGRQKVVYGSITGYESGDEDDARVTVTYSDESLSAVNSVGSASDSMRVPQSRKVTSSVAFGGCMLFDQRVGGVSKGSNRLLREDKSMLCWTWITPDMRSEELVEAAGGASLPRLTCVVRGFLLVFSVKKSTIPNAGYGVFVKAAKLVKGADGGEDDFVLREGEFLDLGVYAPFCSTDKMTERVFFVKSYIHSFKCEECCFNTDDDDYIFDITDDISGEAHEMARKHILVYLNECRKDDVAWVRAEHDPEGSVHYLMGVAGEPSMKRIVIPADGKEKEIFVYYGPDYEPVRLRKGYSELPSKVKEKKLREMELEEGNYLKEIEQFSADEIAACIDYFRRVFTPERMIATKQKFSKRAGRRTLHVLKIFEKRVEELMPSLVEESPHLDTLLGVIQSLLSFLEPVYGRRDS